jgi:hypothetical protein
MDEVQRAADAVARAFGRRAASSLLPRLARPGKRRRVAARARREKRVGHRCARPHESRQRARAAKSRERPGLGRDRRRQREPPSRDIGRRQGDPRQPGDRQARRAARDPRARQRRPHRNHDRQSVGRRRSLVAVDRGRVASDRALFPGGRSHSRNYPDGRAPLRPIAIRESRRRRMHGAGQLHDERRHARRGHRRAHEIIGAHHLRRERLGLPLQRDTHQHAALPGGLPADRQPLRLDRGGGEFREHLLVPRAEFVHRRDAQGRSRPGPRRHSARLHQLQPGFHAAPHQPVAAGGRHLLGLGRGPAANRRSGRQHQPSARRHDAPGAGDDHAGVPPQQSRAGRVRRQVHPRDHRGRVERLGPVHALGRLAAAARAASSPAPRSATAPSRAPISTKRDSMAASRSSIRRSRRTSTTVDPCPTTRPTA